MSGYNDEEPLISVISNYDDTKKEFLKDTAQSLIDQTFPYWKWIIISDDKIDKEILKLDSRIEIKSKKEDYDTELIMKLDLGDVLDKTYLECAYFTLLTNKEASWTYSNCKNGSVIRKNNKNTYPVHMNFNGILKHEVDVNFDELDDSNPINYPVGTYYNYTEVPYSFNWNRKAIKDHSKKNILFIFPWFKMGGADKFNYDLISRMNPDEYDITIITTEPNDTYIYRQKMEKMATIFDLSTFLHREHWASFIDYIIKSRNIDLVMNSNSYYGFYAIPWLKSVNPQVIFTDYLHALNYEWRNGEYPPDSVAISKLLDESFVSCNLIKDTMKNEFGRTSDNVKVSYIGVDINRFKDSNKEIVIDKDLEKYKNNDVILYCCRISEEKQPLKMVDIFNEYLKINNNAILFVVGDGNLLEDMKSKVNKLDIEDKVVFFGNKEDVRVYYKLAKVLVICSKREGITLTSYEALSMGVPVISSNVGAQSELIDSKCGKILDILSDYEEDNKQYVDAINSIINSKDYNKMSEYARERIEKNFSQDDMMDDIINEFEKLIKAGTKVKKEIYDNSELFSRYLLLHNELDRRVYNSPVGGSDKEVNCLRWDELDRLNYYKNLYNEKQKELEKVSNELEAIKCGKTYIYSSKISNMLKKIRRRK